MKLVKITDTKTVPFSEWLKMNALQRVIARQEHCAGLTDGRERELQTLLGILQGAREIIRKSEETELANLQGHEKDKRIDELQVAVEEITSLMNAYEKELDAFSAPEKGQFDCDVEF